MTKRKVVLTISCHLTQHRRKTITPSTTFLFLSSFASNLALRRRNNAESGARERRAIDGDGGASHLHGDSASSLFLEDDAVVICHGLISGH